MKLARESTLAIIAGSLGISGCVSTPTGQPDDRGAARLSELLEGRVAGEPQSCITAWQSGNLEVIDETALVYDAGDTIYVARPDRPESLDSSDILVIERTSSQLCKQDVVRTVDQSSGFMTGVVFLGDFVPFTRR